MIHPAIRTWVQTNLGSEAARSLEPLPWGFSTPTAVATTSDGDRRVIQLFPDEVAATRSRQGALVLEAAGVRVPRVLDATPWQDHMLVVTDYIAGTPAAALISTPASASMAHAMGRIGAVIRKRVAPREATGTWAGPDSLVRAVELPTTDPLHRVLRHAAGVVSSQSWTPALSHGDFVPANALMEGSRLAALVDTADVAYRHPLVDAAWWCLMVRHHHLPESARLITAFVRAGAFKDGPSMRLLANVALLRSAELATAGGGLGNARALFRTAVAWAADE